MVILNINRSLILRNHYYFCCLSTIEDRGDFIWNDGPRPKRFNMKNSISPLTVTGMRLLQFIGIIADLECWIGSQNECHVSILLKYCMHVFIAKIKACSVNLTLVTNFNKRHALPSMLTILKE